MEIKKIQDKSKKIKVAPKLSKNIKRKPREIPVGKRIINAISEICNSNDNLFLSSCENGFAILIKKCIVNTHHVKNPHSMQPRETFEEKTFFHMFALQWKGKEISGKLIDMGMPVIWVHSPEYAYVAIKSI